MFCALEIVLETSLFISLSLDNMRICGLKGSLILLAYSPEHSILTDGGGCLCDREAAQERKRNRNASKYERVGRGVPFPYHWLGHWTQRGSAVGRERRLVLQGGGFGDFQGRLGVDLWRARTDSWAVVVWLPLNFVVYLPFAVKCCQKRHFRWLYPTSQSRVCSDPCS